MLFYILLVIVTTAAAASVLRLKSKEYKIKAEALSLHHYSK
jgi:hypothetical protein